ncbi:hypothetical protein BC941DRAFT_453699 [Chlamydoabsidia padenii]|nr:hypothetical protein BC941DRAFT_453699 [Chlamydoabsidia padenii]
MYDKQKWVEIKSAIIALAQTQLRYQTEGLKALADTATSSRRILTLTNALADETTNPPIDETTNPPIDQTTNPPIDDINNPPIDDTTNNSPTDNTTNPLADDTDQRADNTIDDNDVFLFPGSNDLFSADHCEVFGRRNVMKVKQHSTDGLLRFWIPCWRILM